MARVLGLLCLLHSFAPLLAEDGAVVFVVDPSWDCVESYVAHVPLLQKYKIVKVMTRLGTAPPCNMGRADIYRNFTFNSATPNDSAAAEGICPELLSLGVPVRAVIPTHDPAVYLADQLAACVGVRGNPSEGPLAKARRDKWVMGEAVRKAGLRAVHEKVVSTWSEAKAYLQSLDPPLSPANPVIFKILEGSSSEGVNKVYSLEQAEGIFSADTSGDSHFGSRIKKLLIQEFLQGDEYVIDSVSRDGVHKVVTVWNEELHPGNGVLDLYYGFKAMDPKDHKIQAIIEYANKVLDATGLQNGASDMEVFWLEEEGRPCVVDLNGRWTALMWHDGLALEQETVGNNQITATINAYLDGDAFDDMPLVPSMKQHGAILFTMARQTGFLRDTPGLAVAKKLPSYWGSYNDGMFVGTLIDKLPTSHPCLFILLAHRQKAVVDEDYDRIIGLENSGAWFDIVQSPGNTSLAALRSNVDGLPGQRLPAIAALAMLAAAAVFTLFAMSMQKVRDDTEYLAI
mmetsp:Transcript_85994/g.243510  ORF Transcript_85994/g.243510 Transcript_85994/m.243510 type:complete len:513 (-) Transcript_85994:624-2162(-)